MNVESQAGNQPQQPQPLQPQPPSTNMQLQPVVCYDAQGNQVTVYQYAQPPQPPQPPQQQQQRQFIPSAGEQQQQRNIQPMGVQNSNHNNNNSNNANANAIDYGCGEECNCDCSGVTFRNSLACAVGLFAALLLVIGLGSDEYTKIQFSATDSDSTSYTGCDLICRSTQLEVDCVLTSSSLDYADWCDEDNEAEFYEDFCNLQAMGALSATMLSIALVAGLVAVAYSQPCKPLRLKGNGCCCRNSNFPITLFSVSAALCVVGQLLFVYGQKTICSPSCDEDLYSECAEVETTLALADVCAVFYVICAVLICCCSRPRTKKNYTQAGQTQH